MRSILFAATMLVGLCIISASAMASPTPDTDPMVRIKDKYYRFLEEPVLYERGEIVVSLNLDIRIRLETYNQGDNGVFGSTNSSDTYTTYRNIFGVTLDYGESWSIVGEAIWADAISYEVEPTPSYVANALDLNRLNVSYHNPKWPFAFTVGRQYVKVDDGRLIGWSDWDQTPQRWDVLQVNYTGGQTWDVNFVFGLPVWADDGNFDDASNHENPPIDDDFLFAMLWGGWRNDEAFGLSLFAIAKVDDNSNTQGEDGMFGSWRSYTFGFRTHGAYQGFEYSAGLAAQQGNHGTDDEAAWSGEIRVGYNFDNKMNPKLRASYTIATGDDNPLDTEYNTFDPLYGDFRDRYGVMGVVGISNVEIYHFGGSLEPIENLVINLDVYNFARVEPNDNWYDQRSNVLHTGWFDSTTIGSEIDLVLSYKLDAYTTVSAGFGSLFGSKFLDDLGLKDSANFAFVSIRLKF